MKVRVHIEMTEYYDQEVEVTEEEYQQMLKDAEKVSRGGMRSMYGPEDFGVDTHYGPTDWSIEDIDITPVKETQNA